MHHSDVCIAGAGIIGLSLALELHRRGVSVTVLSQGAPLAEASSAAAGMLAAHDPDNPPRLRNLCDFSLSLYPEFLDHLEDLSGTSVPLQTSTTLQAMPPELAHSLGPQNSLSAEALSLLLPALTPGSHRFTLLSEHSLDPRQIATALSGAVEAASIDLRPHTAVKHLRFSKNGVDIETSHSNISASRFVDCTGAWSLSVSQLPHLRVFPRKGQLLAVELPSSLPLHLVVRTPEIYIVPRTTGATANRAIIGATVEDAGYDKTVHAADIAKLRKMAAALIPKLANCRQLEAWAGLRPATPDLLPVLGALEDQPAHFIATGHYRNGILLAPATARLMAEIITGENPSVDLLPFSPNRHPAKSAVHGVAQQERYSPTPP
jgi:glycine oxidase